MDERKYPLCTYILQDEPNAYEKELQHLVRAHEHDLRLIRESRSSRSIDIERLMQASLADLGFDRGATASNHPGLFHAACDFEVDFFHPVRKIAIEVEKGRRFDLWRDMCKFVESPLIEHAVLLVPEERYDSSGERANTFQSTSDALQNLSRMLKMLKSLLIIGY
jgi:hypothetical protein